MRHHLRKAREVYASGGLLQTIKSALRYIPIEVNNLFFRLRHGEGIRVMNEDWDNLIILDGCRYDMFAGRVYTPGTLEFRTSRGAITEEFIEQNFVCEQFHNTVYLNANPFILRSGIEERIFHAVVDCSVKWDPELQTIRPKAVARGVKRADK